MRNIGKLVALDWKRIVKSPFAFLLILALVVIPSLYCWFNVWALWDPYSNTQDLTVAVYSADKSTEFRDKKIAIGDELVTQLKHNKQLGWRFVDSKKGGSGRGQKRQILRRCRCSQRFLNGLA